MPLIQGLALIPGALEARRPRLVLAATLAGLLALVSSVFAADVRVTDAAGFRAAVAAAKPGTRILLAGGA